MFVRVCGEYVCGEYGVVGLRSWRLELTGEDGGDGKGGKEERGQDWGCGYESMCMAKGKEYVV